MPRALALLAMLSAAPAAVADDFDRLEGQLLESLSGGEVATPRDRLTLADLAAMPNVLDGVRSPVVVARTGLGNPGRLLVSPGLWAPPPPEGADPDDPPEPVPILILERFDTFEAAGGSSPDRLASGRDVFLFDGSSFDLDSGQVVPEGQGGDIAFFATGEAGPRLEPAEGASLFTLSGRPEFPEATSAAPSPGRSVLPGDYAGRFRLFADGSLSGTLDLTVDGRVVSGRFRSDQTGTAYEVRGEVDDGPDPPVRFSIQYPRSRQEYRAQLFSEGKGAMAGTLVMLDRERPFFAVRDGGTIAPEGGETPDLPDHPNQP